MKAGDVLQMIFSAKKSYFKSTGGLHATHLTIHPKTFDIVARESPQILYDRLGQLYPLMDLIVTRSPDLEEDVVLVSKKD